MDAKVDDLGKITAKVHLTFHDDSEPMIRQWYNATARNNWNQLTQQISYAMGYAGDVDNAVVSDPLNLDQPFSISYDYSRDEYITWSGDIAEVRIPLVPILDTSSDDSLIPIKPIPLGGPLELRFTATVIFPDHTKAVPLPTIDDVHSFGEFHARYSLYKNSLFITRTLKLQLRELPLTDVASYRAFTKLIAGDNDTQLHVSKLGKVPDLPPSSDSNGLVAAFRAAMQRRDFVAAHGLGQQFVAQNPKTEVGWSMLGSAELAQLDLQAAAQHFRKQLELYPLHRSAEFSLALVLDGLGDRAGAIKSLQSFIETHPDNSDAKASLANIYIEGKQYKDALSLLSAALASAPDNIGLQSELAQCYMGLDDHRADPLIAKIANTAQTKNNIAYKMAQMNYDLPTAQKLAEQAIVELALQNVSAKLPEDRTAMLANTRLQTAVWDTLGYILYFRGDYTRALDYINASWSIAPDYEVGEHLADLYKKIGDATSEQHIRSLLPGVAHAPANLREAYERKTHTGPQFAFKGGKVINELQEMRTIHTRLRLPEYQTSEIVITSSSAGKTDDVFTESSSSGDPREEYRLIKTAPFPGKIPAGLKTKIIRLGYLTCNPGSDCFIVFMDPNDSLKTPASSPPATGN